MAIDDGRENLRIRVRRETNGALTEFCKRKRISKQDTIDGLLAWFLSLPDEIIQSMVVEQVTARPDLVQLVLDRLNRAREEIVQTPSGEQGVVVRRRR